MIGLACRRLGLLTEYAKGAHLLSAQITAPLTATLVRDVSSIELRRAFTAAARAFFDELRRTDRDLAAHIAAQLHDLTT